MLENVFWEELISVEKKSFYSSSQKISFDRKKTMMELINFVLEKIIPPKENKFFPE